MAVLFIQAQNILKVELDMPNRTTRDYEGPLMAPTLQDALDAALQEEEEMVVVDMEQREKEIKMELVEGKYMEQSN